MQTLGVGQIVNLRPMLIGLRRRLAIGAITAADVPGLPEQGIPAGSTMALVAVVRAGMVYGNVLSDKFPTGEIRVQLRTGDVVIRSTRRRH